MRLWVRTDREVELISFATNRRLPKQTTTDNKEAPVPRFPSIFKGCQKPHRTPQKMRRSASHRSLSPDNLIPGTPKRPPTHKSKPHHNRPLLPPQTRESPKKKEKAVKRDLQSRRPSDRVTVKKKRELFPGTPPAF